MTDPQPTPTTPHPPTRPTRRGRATRRAIWALAICLVPAPLSALDVEIGPDDFPISQLGPAGSTAFGSDEVAVAYNPVAHEYLVVWEGSHHEDGQVTGEYELFLQRVDAATGALLLPEQRRITTIGALGDPAFDAADPAVVFHPVRQEYLVVFAARYSTSESFEIFRIVLDAAGEVVAWPSQVSAAGGPQTPDSGAYQPNVVWNPVADEYLVVWRAYDPRAAVATDEQEVFGQRLSAAGLPVGSDDFRISGSGVGGENDRVGRPQVAHDATRNEYMVVWAGDGDGRFEVYLQLLEGDGGAIGGDYRVTTCDNHCTQPRVAFDPGAAEYLVAYQELTAAEGWEVLGQRIDALTGPEGEPFPISAMGGPGAEDFHALGPSLAFSPQERAYLVTWYGDHDLDGQVDNDFEVFIQRIERGGTLGSPVHLRISANRGLGAGTGAVWSPATAVAPDGTALVAWTGDSEGPDQYEVAGQLVRFAACRPLTRGHQGEGGDPTAVPARSTGCPVGFYYPGQAITLTGDPAPRNRVAWWIDPTGTSEGTLSHLVTMPSDPATVTVGYRPGCKVDHAVVDVSTLLAPADWAGCRTLTAGEVAVQGTGRVTFLAGERVVLGDGFSLGPGAKLVVEIDPNLLP